MNPRIVVAAAAILIPLTAARGQAVSGIVIEQTTGLPVRGVGIVLKDQDARPRMGALSDSLGRYRITAPSDGEYTLTFTRAGLNPLKVDAITLRSGSEEVVNAVLSRSTTTLPTVNVSGERTVDRPPGNPHKYNEFLRRRSLGLGTFLTREEVHARPRHQVHEIFNGIPGLKVRHHGTQWFLRSQRCSGKSIPGLDAGALGGASNSADPKQDPMLFIDGARVRDVSALSNLSPSQIDAVEVYQGASQLPAEARGDACFAIFVWLNNG